MKYSRRIRIYIKIGSAVVILLSVVGLLVTSGVLSTSQLGGPSDLVSITKVEKGRSVASHDLDDDSDPFGWKNLTEEEINRQVVTDWLDAFVHYDGDDRAEIQEAMLQAVRARGRKAVPLFMATLNEMDRTDMAGRYAIIYALGELGRDMVLDANAENLQSLADIRATAKEEIESSDWVEVSAAEFSEEEVERLLHLEDFVRDDRGLLKLTIMTKFAAASALIGMGDNESVRQLRELSQDSRIHEGVRHYIDLELSKKTATEAS